MSDARLLMCTCPDASTATTIAQTLVNERLAACVNRLPGLVSTYRWEGAIEETQEHLLLIKTTAEAVEALSARLQALHPYQVPEIIALDIDRGLPAYLAWIADNVAVSTKPSARS